MKERPIIFSGDMVRAILDGRKSMTRRVIKPQPPNIAGAYWETRGDQFKMYMPPGEPCNARLIHCPYGVPGDALWVKETWALLDPNYHPYPRRLPIPKARPAGHTVVYRADHLSGNDGPEKIRWRSSRFVPKWATRLWLEVVSIRAERLQEITEADVRAEGVRGDVYGEEIGIAPREDPDSAQLYFMELWDKLNAKRGFPWKDNPWVWVGEFKRTDQ